nr:RNA-directed DNA polymerase, eukaryota [Tanacetum cinerariifolium]
MRRYTCWDFHGEKRVVSSTSGSECNMDDDLPINSDRHDLNDMLDDFDDDVAQKEHSKFEKLFIAVEKALYDGINVRNDMEDMGIRPELAAKVIPRKCGTYLPPASYTMSKIKKNQVLSMFARDLVNCVMGEVLHFSSINNLQVLLSNEGFHNARIVYLGGLWVMIELISSKTKLKFMQHVGVASWFRRLCNAQSDFVAKERIVWVDIEGKIFWARAKELFVWSPSFKEVPEKVMCSDDESVKINEEANSLNNDVEESDNDVVSDTYFVDNGEDQGLEHQHGESSNANEFSSDPFNIYVLLDKRTKEVITTGTTTSIPYPPGFTPVNEIPASIKQDATEVESDRPLNRSERSNSRFLEEVANSVDRSSSKSINNGIKLKEGGSILEILEEMITVGQTMGFSMEGCTKDMEKIIGTQGEQIRELISKHKVSFLSIQETKMESVSAMEFKFLWGNYFFNHIISEACGNSGGILCTWDTDFFKKEQHIISDNFVALYGTWIPNKQKLLLILVYAPRSVSSKRMLWSYLASLITSWNGESLIMGDFNEVRFERILFHMGSSFGYLDEPILLREVIFDFGHTPFRFYHSWLGLPGFDDLVTKSWNSFVLDDSNAVWGCGVDKSPGPDGFTFKFFRMSINIQKSHLLGVGILDNCVAEAAKSIGCSIMKAPFKHLGILVGDNMSSIKAWDEAISKMKKRLSRWKFNTLSVGGRLTLLKSMLGSTPIYNMSIFKVPKSILNLLESLRRNFLMAFKMMIERLLGSNGLRCWLLRNIDGWEFQVFMLSIGLFFSSGYGATFLMIILILCSSSLFLVYTL